MTDTRAPAKRERILTAAAELFSRRDFGTVTVDDIAARAGVAKGTVYNHFDSKDALLTEAITTRLEHLVETLTESCRQRDDVRLNVRRVAVHVMSFMLKYQPFFCMWKREEAWVCADRNHAWYGLREHLQRVLVSQLQRGQREGTLRALDPDSVASHIFGAIDGAVLRNLGRVPDDPAVVTERDRLDEFIWTAIRADGREEAAA